MRVLWEQDMVETSEEFENGYFDTHKTRMIALPYGVYNMLSRFHRIPERDGQTDRQRIAISISCSSVMMHNKN